MDHDQIGELDCSSKEQVFRLVICFSLSSNKIQKALEFIKKLYP